MNQTLKWIMVQKKHAFKSPQRERVNAFIEDEKPDKLKVSLSKDKEIGSFNTSVQDQTKPLQSGSSSIS